jgi:hypothetical protein
VYYFGSFALRYEEEKNEITFVNVAQNYLGLKEGDVLVAINGEKTDLDNIDRLFDDNFFDNESPDEVKVEVRRAGTIWVLKEKPVKATKTVSHYIGINPEANDKERKVFTKLTGLPFPEVAK